MKYSEKQIEDLIDDIYNGRVTQTELPEDLYFAIAEHLKTALYKGFGGDLTEFGGKDYELLNELRENVYIFSGAKTYQQVREMSALLADSENFKDFKNKALGVYDTYNKNWLQTEYNTAIGQGMQAQQWNDIQKTKADFPYLKYSAVIDSRTTDICEPINGVTLPVDHPFWNKYTPLNHFNCRCTLEKIDIFEDVKTTSPEKIKGLTEELNTTVNDVFKMNCGKDGYVFKPDHPYFEVAPKDKKLARENFNLPIPAPPKPKEIDPLKLPIDERVKYVKEKAKELDAIHGETLRENERKLKEARKINDDLVAKINFGRKKRILTREEDEKLFNLYKENRAVLETIRNDRNLYLNKYGRDVADLLQNQNTNKGLVVKISKGAKDIPTINEGIDYFKKVAGDKLDNLIFKAELSKTGRAFQLNDKISIALSDTAATVAHELGHGLEQYNKTYFDDIKEFYKQRTQGESPKSLKKLTGGNYRADEKTLEDKFMRAYTGKIYGYVNSLGTVSSQYATEITSMWFTHSFENLQEFIEKDPEHFETIFKLLNK